MTATATKTQEDRRALHAYLSSEAHEQWHEFAAENGVSVSALLEIFGSTLGGKKPMNGWTVDSLVTASRKLDAKRRRRTGINRKS